MSKKVKIILNEWAGYPLVRHKTLGTQEIKCGLVSVLENINNYDAGVQFSIIIILNYSKSFSEKIKAALGLRINPYKNDCRKYLEIADKYDFIEDIIIRDNEGMDIGAYSSGFNAIRNSQFEGDVLFMNSSLHGPLENGWLKKYQSRFYSSKNIGLTGISINSHNTLLKPPEFAPHVQSFLLYSNTEVLKDVFPENLPGFRETNKKNLIENGEIEISRKILDKGYGINCRIFKNFNYFKGDPYTAPKGDVRFIEPYLEEANKV